MRQAKKAAGGKKVCLFFIQSTRKFSEANKKFDRINMRRGNDGKIVCL
jgi:hypothetical protein